MATRIINGIRFTRQADGTWEDESGKYVVEYVDDFEYECDNEHPVKISKDIRRRFNADSKWEQDHRWPYYIREALRQGKRGYLCPGDEVHTYGLWVAGDKGGTDVISRDESFQMALYHAAKHIETGEFFV